MNTNLFERMLSILSNLVIPPAEGKTDWNKITAMYVWGKGIIVLGEKDQHEFRRI
jgi:hypothetical protein